MSQTRRGPGLRSLTATILGAATAVVMVISNPFAASAAPAPAAVTPLNWDTSPEVEAQAQQILSLMTLEEKADLATGELNNFFGFYNNAIARVGIPAQTMADGPVGVRSANPAATNGGKTTQLPSATALAATFDTGLAQQYGALIGDEASRTGNNVSLAPSADTARTPLWGRAFEGFGEDPLLNGTLSGRYIQGVQSNPGVAATIKHFLAYNQETDRFNVDARVTDRALHEIYNRAFQIGVAKGHPAAAMCSFNKVNGVPACSSSLLTSMLKGTDDFRGFVMSDYNATPDTQNAALAGLDQEQPGDQGPDSANFGARLVAAVNAGQVPLARVNDMALRILRGMVGLGLLTTPPVVRPLNVDADAAFARTVAAQSMVLLKNSNGALPLTAAEAQPPLVATPPVDNSPTGPVETTAPTPAADDPTPTPTTEPTPTMTPTPEPTPTPTPTPTEPTPTPTPTPTPEKPAPVAPAPVAPAPAAPQSTIAVIGPDADNTSAQGGGSSTVAKPTTTISPLEGITARAGSGTTVTYDPGTDGVSEGSLLPGPAAVPSSVLTPAGGAPGAQGLAAQYWSNTTFSGDPHLTQVDPTLNVDFGFQNFPGFNVASPKIPTVRGDFALLGDMSARWSGTITAPATADYDLGLTARGDATLTLDGATLVTHVGALSSVSKSVHLIAGQPHSVAISYSAPAESTYQGAQVRFFWTHPDDVLSPMMQAAVDRARTADTAIVVVRDYETEGVDRPDLTLPNEQDQLIRQIAHVNPNTVVVIETGAPAKMSTWDRGVAAVVQAWYPGQEQGAAIADVLFGDVNPGGRLPVTAPIDESQVPVPTAGVANFSEGIYVGYRGYRHNNVRPDYPFGYGLSYTTFRYSDLRTDVAQGTNVTASLRVTNTGTVAGSTVPQVYVGTLPTTREDTPYRQLAGWDKVTLQPGQSQRVAVTLNKQSLSYWDSYTGRWVMPSGTVRVLAGGSSTSLPLSERVRIRSTDVEGASGITRGGRYAISNSVSSQCVDAAGHGTTNGTPVQLWACPAPGANQQWRFTSTGGGYYRITDSETSNKVLDVAGGTSATADGVKVQLWGYWGGSNQQFKPVRIGDGAYHFVALHSGKCLGVAGGSTANGALIEQQTCQSGSEAQSFRLTRQN